jgi:ABC-type transport system involved in multi-copper enzyme maturation permease subunit
MNWVIWQQHKKQFLLFGMMLAAFGVLAVPTGLHFWHTYQQALSTCDTTNSCSALGDQLFESGFDSRMLMFMKAAMVAVPFLLGLFWGAPLIAREYSENTNLLMWTRSISRRKWLTSKLVWTLGATALLTGAFAAIATWWWRTGNTLYLDRFHPLNFAVQGIVPVASALFAVSLGIAFGAWCKRTLLAIGLTLATLIVVQVIIPTMVRPHYMSPKLYTTPMILSRDHDPSTPPTPPHAGAAWITDGVLANKQHELLSWSNPPQQCVVAQAQVEAEREKVQNQPPKEGMGYIGRGGHIVSLSCLVQQGYTWHVSYQPANRYWQFQAVETGLYLGLAAVSLTATYWLVLKRDA